MYIYIYSEEAIAADFRARHIVATVAKFRA